jgi:uncharacterized protein
LSGIHNIPQEKRDFLHILYRECCGNCGKSVILDEIQECPNALTSLKYFCEHAPEYHVVAAGSLLGVKLSRARGFPVGKVHFLHLYPVSFFEFLDAVNRRMLRTMLEEIGAIEPIAEPHHLEGGVNSSHELFLHNHINKLNYIVLLR